MKWGWGARYGGQEWLQAWSSCRPRLPPAWPSRHCLVPCKGPTGSAATLQVAGLPPVIRNHQGPTGTPLTRHPGRDHLTLGGAARRQPPPASQPPAQASPGLLEPGPERAARRLAAGDFTRSRYIWNPLFNH